MTISEQILKDYPHTTTNAQPIQVETVLKQIEATQDVEGEIVEVGCCHGLTSVYITRLLNTLNSKKEFHVYDSFQGLPRKEAEDGQDEAFYTGKFKMPGTAMFEETYRQAKLDLPIIHIGWFKDQIYPEKISFAFLDGDFYSSIMDSLEKVWPRMTNGGVVAIHDFGWDRLPGVEKAVKKFFGSIDMVDTKIPGLGIIKK